MPSTIFRTSWVTVGLLALFGFWLAGCSCEKSKQDDGKEAAPEPLVDRGVPNGVVAEIYPVVGATDLRPVTLVLSGEPSGCSSVKAAMKKSHVICVGVPASESEKSAKEALAYLKKTYPRHVAGQPIALITTSDRSELGWRLMLKEPTFFSRAYLPGLERKVLTATTLAALHGKSAKMLILNGQSDDRLKFLASAAARRGLLLEAVGEGDSALARALSLISESDPRL